MLLSGRSWGLLLVPLVLMLSLSSCGKIPSFLTGGGPNTAANVQVGKTNSQTVGVTKNVAPTVSLRPNSRVDTVDQRVTTQNDTHPSVWLVLGGLVAFAMFLLYLLPSPVKRKKT